MSCTPVHRIALSVTVSACAALVLTAAPTAATAAADPGAHDRRDARGVLADVRKATAAYHDVAAAVADGYRPADQCVASAEGGMGFHYVNPALVDGTVEPTRPEILLYGPGRGGGLTLLGVEYFVPASLVSERPTLAGEPLHGPMDGHEPGMPEHYDLHAWVHRTNPAGVFSEWNPAVSCP